MRKKRSSIESELVDRALLQRVDSLLVSRRRNRALRRFLISLFFGALVVMGITWWMLQFGPAKTIRELLTENKDLQKALANLTREEQIGYAKVVRQERHNGQLVTTVKFVETGRGAPTEIVSEIEVSVPGDVVFFDALIVKFRAELVADGKERAMYLWRRLYSEAMQPIDGTPLTAAGDEPARYEGLVDVLKPSERRLFWSEVGKLSEDTKRLEAEGVSAIYGNAVYKKLKPGVIYTFKINASGQIYPEESPDL